MMRENILLVADMCFCYNFMEEIKIDRLCQGENLMNRIKKCGIIPVLTVMPLEY